MSQNSQFSFNRPYRPFGFNIQVPERTIQQTEQTLGNLVKAPTEPLFNFLEENESVFNGDVAFEINKINAQNFTIGSAMRLEDEKMNGKTPNLDIHF
jgi:effector-binding domain-containing protein